MRRWKGEARKERVMEELAEEGLPLQPLMDEMGKLRLSEEEISTFLIRIGLWIMKLLEIC